MRERQNLSGKVIEGIDVCMQKLQDVKDSASRVPSAKDLARQTIKTLTNLIRQMEAIEKAASKQERR